MARELQTRHLEGRSKVGILLLDDGLGKQPPPTGSNRPFEDNGSRTGRGGLGSLFLFGTASSPVLSDGAWFNTLFGDHGGIHAKAGRQKLEQGKEGEARGASYEAGDAEKDVDGLQTAD